MRALVLLGSLLSLASPLQAATEYLRFEGVIPVRFGPQYTNDGYLYYNFGDAPFEPLGLAVGEFVYFDFAIDRALDAPDRPDDCRGLPAYCLADFFQASYLGGALRGTFPAFGANVSYPELDLTQLFVTGGAQELVVGKRWENVTNFYVDRRISTWVVGEHVEWIMSPYDSGPNVGLQLTYRDATPPPVITPAPSSLWLILTSIAATCGRGIFARKQPL